mmetsp:Transcript_38856/g.112347  ORF Transcript_38856/g.112347 Transcript_38856/m.112347 type:complete len:225 (+) Transcript_38856:1375-2049(+)
MGGVRPAFCGRRAVVEDRQRQSDRDAHSEPTLRGRHVARHRSDLGLARADRDPRHHEGQRLVPHGRRGLRALVRLPGRGEDPRPRRRIGLRAPELARCLAVLRHASKSAAADAQIHTMQDGLQHGLVGPGRGPARRFVREVQEGHGVRRGHRGRRRLLLRALDNGLGRRRALPPGRLREVRPELPAARPRVLPEFLLDRAAPEFHDRDPGIRGVLALAVADLRG